MTDPSSFTPFAPGFEFLQGLVKNAGAAMPGMGQWVTPTLDPEELDKRIQDLRTVQFWLEQNARMLGATIQALEVQKMTLATLQTLNVQMGDLRDSLTIRRPAPAAEPPAPEPEPAATASPKAPEPADTPAPAASADTGEPKPAVVDPVQWWGALTKQFSELASTALKDGAAGLSATPPVTRPAASKKSTPAAKARGASVRPTAATPKAAARPPARKRAAAARKSTRT